METTNHLGANQSFAQPFWRSQEAKRLRQRIAPSQSPAPWDAFQPPLDVRVQVRVEPGSTKRGDCDWEIIYVYNYIIIYIINII